MFLASSSKAVAPKAKPRLRPFPAQLAASPTCLVRNSAPIAAARWRSRRFPASNAVQSFARELSFAPSAAQRRKRRSAPTVRLSLLRAQNSVRSAAPRLRASRLAKNIGDRRQACPRRLLFFIRCGSFHDLSPLISLGVPLESRNGRARYNTTGGVYCPPFCCGSSASVSARIK